MIGLSASSLSPGSLRLHNDNTVLTRRFAFYTESFRPYTEKSERYIAHELARVAEISDGKFTPEKKTAMVDDFKILSAVASTVEKVFFV